MESKTTLARIFNKQTNEMVTINSKNQQEFKLSLNGDVFLNGQLLSDCVVDKYSTTINIDGNAVVLYENDVVISKRGKIAIVKDCEWVNYGYANDDYLMGAPFCDFYINKVIGNIHQNPEYLEIYKLNKK